MAVSAQSRFERFYLVVIDMLLLLLNWYPYVVLLLRNMLLDLCVLWFYAVQHPDDYICT